MCRRDSTFLKVELRNAVTHVASGEPLEDKAPVALVNWPRVSSCGVVISNR